MDKLDAVVLAILSSNHLILIYEIWSHSVIDISKINWSPLPFNHLTILDEKKSVIMTLIENRMGEERLEIINRMIKLALPDNLVEES